ncbi:MAG TPA: PKD domain-containing protein [Chitinophagales bacterium]|nr:PKD domain-containing protein [Chitinophagales bacterium]
MKQIFPTLLMVCTMYLLQAQCINNIDFNSWAQAGWAANGNWVVQNGGSQVRQTINGNPTFYISPYELINVKITGNFKTTDSDDDFMGFVFCFHSPISPGDGYNTWLFDWKRGTQTSNGYTAQKGMSLDSLNGTILSGNYNQTFWGHQNTPEFTCVANTFGGAGWVQNYNHSFELDLSFTRATIYIDGNLVFDHASCYLPGRFGFYNYSQQDCYYSNFQYSMNINFDVLTPQVCPGQTAYFQFFNNCTGINYNFSQYQTFIWDYGDGTVVANNNPTAVNVNTSHIYATPGNYIVKLKVVDGQGCSDSATQQITVLAPPMASFTVPAVCNGNPVAIINNTTGSPNSWQWDFGDATTSTLQSPSHLYAGTGNYIITLIAADSIGCADTAQQQATINPNPSAAFTATTQCQGTATTFTDASSGNPVQWRWSFGDGNTSTQQNPSNTYASANSYMATLIATNSFGCPDTTTNLVTVNPNPVAAFNAPSVCYYSAAQFTDQSTGSPVQWHWDFGDTQTSPLQNPSHSYISTGTYPVTLTATTALGCSNTVQQNFTAWPQPVASFTVAPVCFNGVSQFVNNSAISSGNITNYAWAFGDGATSAQVNPAYTYAAPGTYMAGLIVQSDSGCLDTANMAVTVYPNPVANFNIAPACAGSTTAFTDASTIATGSTLQWNWDFGNGQNSVSQNPVNTYTTPGVYTVTLIAASQFNCTDTISKQINAFYNPTAAFSVPSVCNTAPSVFGNSSTIGQGSIIAQAWSFGDGATSNQLNPSHTYAGSGTYNVTLVVQSDSSCFDTLTQQVVVYPLPVVNFGASAVCPLQTSIFNNNTTIGSESVIQWAWDFGDGNASTLQSPSHSYANTGNYNAILVATSDNGCADSASQTITVYDVAVAQITTTPACYHLDNGTATVLTTGGTAPFSWHWSSGQYTATASGLFAGSYTVTVTDAHQCTSTATDIITEPPLPLTLTVDPADLNIKLNQSLQMQLGNSYNDDNALYSIQPGYGLSCNTCADFNAIPYQTTTYNVLITDALGCTGNGSFAITVDQTIPVFIPNVFSPNGDGSNDTWGIESTDIKQFKVSVFDRWGEKVFEGNNIYDTWDGTFKGKPAPEGVYIYEGTMVFLNNQTKDIKGTVTLLR